MRISLTVRLGRVPACLREPRPRVVIGRSTNSRRPASARSLTETSLCREGKS